MELILLFGNEVPAAKAVEHHHYHVCYLGLIVPDEVLAAMTTGASMVCLAETLLVQMVPAQYDAQLKVLRPGEVIQLQLI